MTATTPIRARLRAARDRRRAEDAVVLERPYSYRWLRSDDMWTLVVRVTATGQMLRCGYAVRECPGDEAGANIAARLYRMRAEESRT